MTLFQEGRKEYKMRSPKRSKNSSVISNPKFKKWVRSFDFCDPKFLAEVDRLNKESEAWLRDLRRAKE